MLVALVVGQQRCGTFGLFDVAGVVAEMVLDDAQGTRLRVGGFADDDRHVVAVAVDVARRAPTPLAGHDLEHAVALGMRANLDRLRHAAGCLEPFLQCLHRLRIEIPPMVRPRDDVTELQCGLHSASLWRVRQGSAQGHGPVHRSPVNPRSANLREEVHRLRLDPREACSTRLPPMPLPASQEAPAQAGQVIA